MSKFVKRRVAAMLKEEEERERRKRALKWAAWLSRPPTRRNLLTTLPAYVTVAPVIDLLYVLAVEKHWREALAAGGVWGIQPKP